MLGKTHKAFGVASLATTGLLYHGVTGYDVTHAFIPTIRDLSDKIPFEQLLEFSQHPFARLGMATLMVIGVLAGSSYPDIDHEKDTRHRGWAHNIWCVLVLIGIAMIVGVLKPGGIMTTWGAILPFLFGVVLGYMSHLLADACSVNGIQWLYPIMTKKRIVPVLYRTGDKWHHIPASFIWGVIAFVLTIAWSLTIS